jgi:hypothetical protein
MKNTNSSNVRSKSTKRSAIAAADAPQPAADLVKLGQELLAQQRAIRERIPDFVLPHPSHARLTGTAARVTETTVNEGLAACTTHASLAGAIDAAEVQYGQDYESAFTELRDEMEKSFTGLDYSMRLKRHNNGKAMLRILALARSLVKSPENAGLAVHIEAMKKGFKRRRRATTPETPAPPTLPVGDLPAVANATME